MKSSIALIALLLSFTLQAYNLTTEEKLSDLKQLTSAMRTSYGPLIFKKEQMGIDLEKLEDKYTQLISQTKTNSEFYYLMVQFVAEFKDGHFYARVPSKHRASVPFYCNWVDGKILIETIDRKKLSKKDFPFEKGDEIVEVDGEDVKKVIEFFAKYISNGNEVTRRALAAYKLTSRSASSTPVPTKKKVSFKIRRGTSDIIESVELDWTFSGKAYDEYAGFKPKNNTENAPLKLDELPLSSLDEVEMDVRYHCSGDTRISIPKDATVIMRKPFVAYYHPTEKGNIGYLRIPHYSPRSASGADERRLRFSQYEYAVKTLEEKTAGLIIDQDHNCGGSVAYLNNIFSLFIKEKTAPINFKLLSNKKEFLLYENWHSQGTNYTISFDQYASIRDLIHDSWVAGKPMTPMTAISGEKFIYPNRIRYTKPIVMLIDQMSGSGGDAFPALMQGNKRATLIGTRTMGLGGHVNSLPALNNSGITLMITKSLFYRPDNVEVENNGVSPDIPYTITRDDFLYGFKSYQKKYLSELFKLIK